MAANHKKGRHLQSSISSSCTNTNNNILHTNDIYFSITPPSHSPSPSYNSNNMYYVNNNFISNNNGNKNISDFHDRNEHKNPLNIQANILSPTISPTSNIQNASNFFLSPSNPSNTNNISNIDADTDVIIRNNGNNNINTSINTNIRLENSVSIESIHNGYDTGSSISDDGIDSLIIVTWNIGGFSSKKQITADAKAITIKLIIDSYRPDILNILEGRVHYEAGTTEVKSEKLEPLNLEQSGYYCHAGGTPLYDPKLKTITYYPEKHIPYVRKLNVSHKTSNRNSIKCTHWITWTILENAPKSVFDVPVINAAYYRSPTPENIDVHNLSADILEITPQVPPIALKRIIINTDINLHAPEFSLNSKTNFLSRHKSEAKKLKDLLQTHKLQIINEPNVPTHYYVHDQQQKGSIIDLTIASDLLINNHYKCEVIIPPRINITNIIGANYTRMSDICGSKHVPILAEFYDYNFHHKNIHKYKNKHQIHKHIKKQWNWYKPKDINKYKKLTIAQITNWYKKYRRFTHFNNTTIDDMAYQLNNIFYLNADNYIGIRINEHNKIMKIWGDKEVVDISQKMKGIWYKYIQSNKTNKHLHYVHKKYSIKKTKKINELKAAYGIKKSKQIHTKNNNWWKNVSYFKDINKCRKTFIPFLYQTKDTGAKIFDDYHKANKLNKMYCHGNHPIRYNALQKMDFQFIPTLNRNIYPKNDVKAAEYIKNPSLPTTTPMIIILMHN